MDIVDIHAYMLPSLFIHTTFMHFKKEWERHSHAFPSDLNPAQMLHDLGWCDLKDRRRDLRLALLSLLYKIVTGHVAINPDQIGLVAAVNRTRANHLKS